MNVYLNNKKYFPTPLQEFVFYDKYSRFNWDLGRRETWEETVDRAVDYLYELSNGNLNPDIFLKMRQYILEMKIMPSMRLLAMAGPAAKRNNLCIYNCSYQGMDSPYAFGEALLISMSGCGVGFSVEKRYTEQLPNLPKELTPAKVKYRIQDNTEGWQGAIDHCIFNLYEGRLPDFIYDDIRPRGTPLKTKGGTASGPEPLKEAIDFITQLFASYYRVAGTEHQAHRGVKEMYWYRGADRPYTDKLLPEHIHLMMCAIGSCAVSGGMRRTAMISLFDKDDGDMLAIKTGNYHKYLYNANNSLVFTEEPTQLELISWFSKMAEGNNGEPGFFSRHSAKNSAPSRRQADLIDGLNPCQPAFAKVLTTEGIRLFGDVEVGSTIWSGKRWTKIVDKKCTGIKPVFEYRTSFGSFIGTENHQVFQEGERIEVDKALSIDVANGEVERQELNPQDIMDGLVVGDGSVHKASNNLVHLNIGENDHDYLNSEVAHLIKRHRPKLGSGDFCFEINTTITCDELPYTYERIIPNRFYYGNRQTTLGFLRGLFSANGYVTANGMRIGLKQTSYNLISSVQEMLSAVGIRSYITINKSTTVKHHNGDYKSKQSYDLNITTDRYKFKEMIGFIQEYKNNSISGGVNDRSKTALVQARFYRGEHEVYDITVEADEHSYWTGGLLVSNCGEITLRNKQLCNLSAVVAREDDTEESLLDKIEMATIIGTIQASATHFPGLRKEWEDNCREEALLGVDITGQMDCVELSTIKTPGGFYVHPGGILRRLKERAIETNEKYSRELGINAGAAITCNKPSGNTSQLVNCASGIHPRFAKYYLKNIRVNVDTPVFQVLVSSGLEFVPENGQTRQDMTTAVFSFPVKSPDGAITKEDVSAYDMCVHWWSCKKYYTEHNPSVTINYKNEEVLSIVNWLWTNKDIIGGMAFLPFSGAEYENMPYQEITEEEYEERIAKFPDINWQLLEEYEVSDTTTVAQEKSCFANACEL